MAGAAHPTAPSTPLEEVRERFRVVEEAEPGTDRARYVEALKAFLATAERLSDSIGKDGPAVAPLLDQAAMAFYRASSPDLAERAVELGLRLSPGSASLLHHKALVLLALNRDLPTVVQLVDQALAIDPNERDLWATRGDALRLLERPGEAADAYVRAQELETASTEYVDRALKVAPGHPKALRLKVDLARARGGDLQALDAAEALLRQNPEDVDLMRFRAELLAAVGRKQDALEALRHVPGEPNAASRVFEIRLLFDLGKGEEAAPLASALVAGDPAPAPRALEEIAKASSGPHPDLALAARERLRQVDPRNVQNLLDLKLLATRLGRLDAALDACRAVLATSPDNLEAMRGLAELETAVARPGPALEAYRALARAHPHALADLRKALELARSSARSDAVHELAEAILAAEPSDADARRELARSLMATGDLPGALAQYDALLEAHPGELSVLLEKRDLLVRMNDRVALGPVLDEIFHLDPTRTDVAVDRGNVALERAYDLAEGSSEREQAARAALVAYERASSDPEAADISLLGIARASRLVGDHDRALGAYTEFLEKEPNRGRLDVRKERAHTLQETGRYAEAAEEYERVLQGGLDEPNVVWGAAETYARLNRDAPALRLLDVLLRREPANPMFLRRKGQLLLKMGRREDALRVLQQAVHGAEADPQAHFEVAEALRAQGAYADAITYYRQGLEIDPKSRHGRLALAETLLLAGQYPDVISIVDPLLKEDANDLAAWKARADAWRALGRSTEVLYSLEAILLLEPESGPALLEMYRLRRERGELKEAHEALGRLVRSSAPESQDPALHLEHGDLAASLGLPDEANAAYERAAQIDPAMRVEIALRRARLRLAAGRPDLALEVLDEGTKDLPEPASPSVAALLLRAEVLGALERPAEARVVYEDVRKREPKSPTASAGVARSMIAEGRHGDAVAFLKEVLPELPPEDETVLLLAEAESGLGHLDQARAAVRRGLDRLPRSVALWSRLGEIGIARQDWPEASSAFAHALAVTPGSVELLMRAGFVAERLNHPNEALAFYDRATAAEPNHKQAWTSRGLALLATGRPPDAIASFERALALDSDFAPAKEGKKLAAQRTRDVEIQRYGREALLLEARQSRPVTKNDLFVTLHVPFEFLEPVLRELGRRPKLDLARLNPDDVRELEDASYQIITAALERRPSGIERRGLTLADIAVLAPANATLEQDQKLFGYLQAVLEADLPLHELALPPDVQELARQALGLPPESRTLFQLVRTLRVGLLKARLIKAVEDEGRTVRAPLPSLDLGAYSPEFRAPPAEEKGKAAPSSPAGPPPSAVEAGAVTPAPARPAAPPPPEESAVAERCVGCGGLASVVHSCGGALCPHCAEQHRKCPKCAEPISDRSTRPVQARAHAPRRDAPTPGAGPSGGPRGAVRRPATTHAEPPAAPGPISRGLPPRHAPPHRPEHEAAAKDRPAAERPPAPPKKPAAEAPPPASKAPAPAPAASAPASASSEKTPAVAPKPKSQKPDDEPRL